MKFRSPKTGRFISLSTYHRWYVKGKPLFDEYLKFQKKILGKKSKPLEKLPDYFEITDEPEEFEASGEYDG